MRWLVPAFLSPPSIHSISGRDHFGCVVGKVSNGRHAVRCLLFGSFRAGVEFDPLGCWLGCPSLRWEPAASNPVCRQRGGSVLRDNQHLMTRVFGWFLFRHQLRRDLFPVTDPAPSGPLRSVVCVWRAGLLMLAAPSYFGPAAGKFVHAPPSGNNFVKGRDQSEGRGIIGRLALIYVFSPSFVALYQTFQPLGVAGGQNEPALAGLNWESSQLQAVNSILIWSSSRSSLM